MSLSAIRSLTRRYVAALAAIALLALVGQAVIQTSLSAQRQEGRVINLAGRQRMLSQKVVKDVLASSLAADSATRQARTNSARRALATWRSVHRGLQVGDEALGLPGDNSDGITARYAAMEPAAQRFAAAADRALGRLGDAAAADALLEAQAAYLPLMDAVVFAYDAETQRAVRHVRTLEAVIFGLTLVVLLVEGLFVFRPIVERTRRVIQRLTKTNAKLATARQAAEGAERTKAAILSNMSHEVRTPLQSVMGYAELLRAETGPEYDDIVAPIERGARRLLNTLDSIIEVARLSGGEAVSGVSASVDVGAVAEGVVALFEPDAEAKGLSLSLDVRDDVVAVGESAALSRAVAAVVDNAIKFTEAGRVEVAVGWAGGRARVCVSDTGIGLDVSALGHLGDAFSQHSEGHARSHEGIGLGLTLATRLVEAMGGEVRIASDQGTQVEFVLPGVRAEEATPNGSFVRRRLTPAFSGR